MNYSKLAFVILTSSIVFNSTVKSEINTDHRERKNQQLMVETTHILGGFRNRVPRWSGSIRLGVVGLISEAVESDLDVLVTQLSLYTGLKMDRVEHDFTDVSQYLKAILGSPEYDLNFCSRSNPEVCANLVVIVSSQTMMNRITMRLPMRSVYQSATGRSKNIDCFFSPGISSDFEIKQSVVFINNNLSQQMQSTCLQEEITQSLGLFNDYTGSQYYSFNNVVAEKSLTAYDKILLSSLYDRAFEPGTLAASIAEQVIDYCQFGCIAGQSVKRY